jgi:molybdate transport system regulatory protein
MPGKKSHAEGCRGNIFLPEKHLRLERFFVIRNIVQYITMRLSRAFCRMKMDRVVVGEAGRKIEKGVFMQEDRERVSFSGKIWIDKAQREYLGSDRIELLEKIQALGSITRAAKAVGISYKTAWEIVDTMNNLAEKPLVVRMTGGKGGGGTHLTPEGHEVIQSFRIVQEEHKNFLLNLACKVEDMENFYKFLRRMSLKVSARNIFKGTVTRIRKGAVNSEVELVLPCGDSLVSVVTNESVENLGLYEGKDSYAIIKASSVILGRDLHTCRLSAGNIMCGSVVKVVPGAVNTEVTLRLSGDNTISAVITNESAAYLGFTEGDHACAIFQASSVILGVE